MRGKYIIIPPESFMKRFAPHVSDKRRGRCSDIFKCIPAEVGKEHKMYEPMVTAINNSTLCPNFTMVATPSRGDPSDESKEAIDMGLYPTGCDPQPILSDDPTKPPSLAVSWSDIDLCFECKTTDDAHGHFDDETDDAMDDTQALQIVLEQVLSKLELVWKRQQRMFVYVVLIMGHHCRIIRVDRSGAVVTENFKYTTANNYLVKFLWRYSRWSSEQRGHDPSAERVPHDSALGQKMVQRASQGKDVADPGDYVRRQFEESLRDDWSWWKLRVDCGGRPRSFLVGKPHFQADGVAGRGTHGYIALDADDTDGPLYYLKDAWRVRNRGIHKEGKTLGLLNKKGVRFVPTLECHGDVLSGSTEDEEGVSRSGGQVTKTGKVWEDMHKGEEGVKNPFKTHKHYRIVVREVGKRMAEFTNARELVYAMYCAIFAHSEAFDAGVMHRDVSAGNVLLYYDPTAKIWSGLLTDWELSKQTQSTHTEGRQIDRTGTWQFMSADALDKPTKEIVVQDELESFFHVLLFFAVRFLPHNLPSVPEWMSRYFDDYTTMVEGHTCGSYKMLCITHGTLFLKRVDDTDKDKKSVLFLGLRREDDKVVVDPTVSHPLNDIFGTVLEWIFAYYYVTGRDRPSEGNGAGQASASAPTAEPQSAKGKKLVFPEKKPKRKTFAPVRFEKADAAEYWDKQAAIAENLAEHEPLLEYLRQCLENDAMWPEEDKIGDQLSRKYDPNRDPFSQHCTKPGGSNLENRSGAVPSSKRRSEHIDGSAQQGRRKRTKSTGTRRKAPDVRRRNSAA